MCEGGGGVGDGGLVFAFLDSYLNWVKVDD